MMDHTPPQKKKKKKSLTLEAEAAVPYVSSLFTVHKASIVNEHAPTRELLRTRLRKIKYCSCWSNNQKRKKMEHPVILTWVQN